MAHQEQAGELPAAVRQRLEPRYPYTRKLLAHWAVTPRLNARNIMRVGHLRGSAASYSDATPARAACQGLLAATIQNAGIWVASAVIGVEQDPLNWAVTCARHDGRAVTFRDGRPGARLCSQALPAPAEAATVSIPGSG